MFTLMFPMSDCLFHGRLWQFAHPRPLSLLQRGLAPRSKGKARAELSHPGASHVSHTPAACSFPGENARSWEALGEARPGLPTLYFHPVCGYPLG